VSGSRRFGEIALGTAIVALAALALPLGLAHTGSAKRLHAEIDGSGPYQLVASGVAPPPVSLGPESILKRLDPAGVADQRGPGLALRGWAVEYGKRWHRGIDIPLLMGPFDRAGQPDGCGFSVRIRPGVFEATKGGGALAQIAKRQLNANLPVTFRCGPATKITLPKATRVQMVLSMRRGHILVSLGATLPDTTRIGARTRLAFRNEDGRLQIQRTTPLEPLFEGPLRDECSGAATIKVVDFVRWLWDGTTESIVTSEARATITNHIGPVIRELNSSLGKLNQPFSLFEQRPQDRISLRLGSEPVVSPEGLVLTLCPAMSLASPKVDSAITGPPRSSVEPPRFGGLGSPRAPRIDLLANAHGMNQLLYVLWQTGQLSRWGRSSVILDRLPDDIRALAFDVTGFDPRLPPVLSAVGTHPGSVRIRFANVAVGSWDQRTVLGHVDVDTQVRGQQGRVSVGGELAKPKVQCAQQIQPRRWRLTPCLSELMPLLADRIAGQPMSFHLDLSWILRKLSRHSLGGMGLKLSDLKAQTASPPATLHSSVAIRLTTDSTTR